MTILYSTGLKDFVGVFGSYKQAFQGGSLVIYGGTVPATANAAVTGTPLVVITKASGTLTNEICSAGSVTVAGNAGAVSGIVVDSKEILGTTCTFVDTLANLAILIASTINSYLPVDGPRYRATASDAKVIITATPGKGTSPNGKDVTASVTGSVTTTDVNMGTEVAGVASANGLTFGSITSGLLYKSSDIWSGTIATSGTATHWRFLSSVADAGALSTTAIRLQGTCGYNSGDYPMSSTTLTAGKTVTVDDFYINTILG